MSDPGLSRDLPFIQISRNTSSEFTGEKRLLDGTSRQYEKTHDELDPEAPQFGQQIGACEICATSYADLSPIRLVGLESNLERD